MVFLWIIGALWLGLVSLKIYSSSPKTSNDQRIIQTILEEADPETSIQLIKYAPQDLQLMADWASSQVIRRFDPVDPEEVIHSGGIIIGYPDDQLVKNLIEHDYQQIPYRDGTEIWQKR